MFTLRSDALPAMFRALRHRNYRLYFSGQGISLVGTWMTRLATGWLVWRLTHSAEMLGLVGFAGQVPSFLLASFAGVWVDRLNRHRLLMVTQALAMIQSLTLAALVLSGSILVWQIFALQILQGIINAFDMPTRQSLLVDLLDDRRDLANAVALNSTMVNGARLIGPSLAGLLIAWAGEGWCFLIDGLSYLAVLVTLCMMRLAIVPHAGKRKRVIHELYDGLRYAFGFSPIRAILLLLALFGLVGIPFRVLMPIITTHSLHGSANTLGFLMGAMGVGALIGALFLATRTSVLGLGKLIPVATGIFGLSLIGIGVSHSYGLSLAVMLVTGFGFMVQLAISNTLLQTLVREDMRGRVMSLYTMAFMGMATFGSLLAGFIAGLIGAPMTLVAAGLMCIVGAVGFAWRLPKLRQQARPVYIEKGVISVTDESLLEATDLEEKLDSG